MTVESTHYEKTDTVTIRRRFDPASASVIDELFVALQDVDRAFPVRGPPLAAVLDPDALDCLFPVTPPKAGAAIVTFTYAGTTIVISGEGFVRIEAPVDIAAGTAADAKSDSLDLAATSDGV